MSYLPNIKNWCLGCLGALLLLIFTGGVGRAQTPVVTLSANTIITSSDSMCVGTINNNIYSFKLTSVGAGAVTLTRISFSPTVTPGPGEIAVNGYKLWKSTSGSGTGTLIAQSSTDTFTSFISQPITAPGVDVFWITADITSSTGAGTIRVAQMSAGDILVASPATVNASGSGTLAGAIQSIDTVLIPTISGASKICAPSTITLSGLPVGGTWVSSADTPIATLTNIAGSRVVARYTNAVGSGLDTIVYTVRNACGSFTATQPIVVDSTQHAAPITGATAFCNYALPQMYSNTVSGGIWKSSNTNVLIDPVTGAISYNLSGTDSATSTITYVKNSTLLACPDSVTKNITVNPRPNTAIADASMCSGTFLTLSHDAGFTSAAWSSITNTIISINATTGLIFASGPGPAFVIYSATNLHGCSGSDTAQITVNPTPPLIGGNKSVCVGGTTSLVESGAGNWSITPSNVTVSSTTGVVTANSLGTGTATVNYTLNGCTIDTTITINATPVLTTTTYPVCSGALSTLPLNPGVVSTFSWYANDTPGIGNNLPDTAAVGQPVTIQLNNFTNIQVPIIYHFTTTNASARSCVSHQDVTILVDPAPHVLVSSVLPICSGASTSIPFASSVAGHNTFRISYTNAVLVGPATIDTIGGLIAQTLSNTDSAHKFNGSIEYVITAFSPVGCQGNDTTITQTVYPSPIRYPVDTSDLVICSNKLTSIKLTGSDTSSIYTWTVFDSVDVHGATSLSGNTIRDSFISNSNATNKFVTYDITTTSHLGCPSANPYDRLTITVNPLPTVSLSSSTVCSELTTQINLDNATALNTLSFSWSVDSIFNVTGAFIDTDQIGINQKLRNIGHVSNGFVKYGVIALSLDGCYGPKDIVTVTVYPSPILIDSLTETTCSGYPFTYTPTFSTGSGTTATWQVFSNPADDIISTDTITIPTTGVIHQTILSRNFSANVSVVTFQYAESSIHGCINTKIDTINVIVNPTPQVLPILSLDSLSPCIGSEYLAFNIPTAGLINFDHMQYVWTTKNGQHVDQATSTTGLVTFSTSGTDYVMLTANYNGFNRCISVDSTLVTVQSKSIDNATPPTIIYNNSSLICLKNDVDSTDIKNRIQSYQWGYDDATTLHENPQEGAIYQTYYKPDVDSIRQYWWVKITDLHGCPQKSYKYGPFKHKFTVPEAAVTSLSMKLYPNPASSELTIEMNDKTATGLFLELYDMTGRKAATVLMDSYMTKVPVEQLPAGSYLVVCRQNGINVATTQFIKN